MLQRLLKKYFILYPELYPKDKREEKNKTSNKANDSTIDKQKEKEGYEKIQNDKEKAIQEDDGDFKELRRKSAYRMQDGKGVVDMSGTQGLL